LDHHELARPRLVRDLGVAEREQDVGTRQGLPRAERRLAVRGHARMISRRKRLATVVARRERRGGRWYHGRLHERAAAAQRPSGFRAAGRGPRPPHPPPEPRGLTGARHPAPGVEPLPALAGPGHARAVDPGRPRVAGAVLAPSPAVAPSRAAL